MTVYNNTEITLALFTNKQSNQTKPCQLHFTSDNFISTCDSVAGLASLTHYEHTEVLYKSSSYNLW